MPRLAGFFPDHLIPDHMDMDMDMDMGRLNVTVSRRAVLACGDARRRRPLQ